MNRYPDGGSWRLGHALAERHGVDFENVTVCSGADAVIGYLTMVALDPGDEAITGWPSFPSYVLDTLKLGGVPVRVPLREDRFDLEAIIAAITPRTKLVFIAAPNNPTGTTNSRAELEAYFADVPPQVLTVVDQAYFEYVMDPDYPDAIEEFQKAGSNVLVLRTFSKIFGLAGLRVGYGVGPVEVIAAIGKVRRAFDVSSSPRRLLSRASTTTTSWLVVGRPIASRWRCSPPLSASAGSIRWSPRSRTSCSSVRETPSVSTTPCFGRESSFVRWALSVHRTR